MMKKWLFFTCIAFNVGIAYPMQDKLQEALENKNWGKIAYKLLPEAASPQEHEDTVRALIGTRINLNEPDAVGLTLTERLVSMILPDRDFNSDQCEKVRFA